MKLECITKEELLSVIQSQIQQLSASNKTELDLTTLLRISFNFQFITLEEYQSYQKLITKLTYLPDMSPELKALNLSKRSQLVLQKLNILTIAQIQKILIDNPKELRRQVGIKVSYEISQALK